MRLLVCLAACLIPILFATSSETADAQASPGDKPDAGLHQMEFTLGEWDFHALSRRPGGEVQARFRSRVEYTLDKKACLDTFCTILPDGTFDPQGSTVRTYDAAAGKWRMVFYGSSLDFVTEFEGEFEDGEFHFRGKGHQRGREFLERVTFHSIEQDRYSWTMDRSFDDGSTWIEAFFSYDAVRVE